MIPRGETGAAPSGHPPHTPDFPQPKLETCRIDDGSMIRNKIHTRETPPREHNDEIDLSSSRPMALRASGNPARVSPPPSLDERHRSLSRVLRARRRGRDPASSRDARRKRRDGLPPSFGRCRGGGRADARHRQRSREPDLPLAHPRSCAQGRDGRGPHRVVARDVGQRHARMGTRFLRQAVTQTPFLDACGLESFDPPRGDRDEDSIAPPPSSKVASDVRASPSSPSFALRASKPERTGSAARVLADEVTRLEIVPPGDAATAAAVRSSARR